MEEGRQGRLLQGESPTSEMRRMRVGRGSLDGRLWPYCDMEMLGLTFRVAALQTLAQFQLQQESFARRHVTDRPSD